MFCTLFFVPSLPQMTTLSILIPTYNSDCVQLVSALSAQVQAIEGLDCEIVVSDDGSTRTDIMEHNRQVSTMPMVRYVEQSKNLGRAAHRNLLAGMAKHPWLLFIDSHMAVRDDSFVRRYVEQIEARAGEEFVCHGGYETVPPPEGRQSLRYIYEKKYTDGHTASVRQQHEHQEFHTCNFLVPHSVMLRYPFDERLRGYGYEDVLWGKVLSEAAVPVCHIDNALFFDRFESNESYMLKTEEALRSLHDMSGQMRGYSRLLALSDKLRRWHLSGAVRLWHRLTGGMERRHLCGQRPTLLVFNLYRLGYLLRIQHQP